MMIVDAHLDLAYNATRGRDPRQPALTQPVVEGEIATVGMPDLAAGQVKLICATIFCEPVNPANKRDTPIRMKLASRPFGNSIGIKPAFSKA